MTYKDSYKEIEKCKMKLEDLRVAYYDYDGYISESEFYRLRQEIKKCKIK